MDNRMLQNTDRFALYSAKIFQILYDAFPVPISIDRDEVIAQYLSFDQHDELKELKLRQDFAEIAKYADDEELKQKVDRKLPEIERAIADLEALKRSDRIQQEEIYAGTLSFFLSEGIIRECSPSCYQLTSKGFSHLSKSFKEGSIRGEESTNISALKKVAKVSADTSLQVAAGVAINVITRIAGYSS